MKQGLIIFIFNLLAAWGPGQGIAYADENLTSLKLNIIENCAEAKNQLGLIPNSDKHELIKYLAKVANFRINDDQEINQQLAAIIPSTKPDLLKGEQALNIFQRDEKVRTLEPEKESAARRCALDMLEMTTPLSFAAVRQLLEIYEKSPDIPSDPDFLAFLHSKTIRIITKSLADPALLIDQDDLHDLVDYYYEVKSINVKFALLAILEERRSLVINYILEKILSSQEVKYLNLIAKIAFVHEQRIIFNVMAGKYLTAAGDQTPQAENFQKELLKLLFVASDPGFFKDFKLPENSNQDEIMKNTLSEKFFERFINRKQYPEISNELLAILFNFSSKDNNYKILSSYFAFMDPFKDSLLLTEVNEVFSNNQLTTRKKSLINFLVHLPVFAAYNNEPFTKLLLSQDLKSRIYTALSLISIKKIRTSEGKNIQGIDLIREFVASNESAQSSKKSVKAGSPPASQRILNEYLGEMLNSSLVESEGSPELAQQRTELIRSLLALEDEDLTLDVLLNAKDFLNILFTTVSPEYIKKLNKNSLLKLSKRLAQDKANPQVVQNTGKLIRFGLQNRDLLPLLASYKSQPAAFKKALDKLVSAKPLSAIDARELIIDKPGVVDCAAKLEVIFSLITLLNDPAIEATLNSCLKAELIKEMPDPKKEYSKFTFNLTFDDRYLAEITAEELQVLISNFEKLNSYTPKVFQLKTLDLLKIFDKILLVNNYDLLQQFLRIFLPQLLPDNTFKEKLPEWINNQQIKLPLRLNLCFLYQIDSTDKSICRNLAINASPAEVDQLYLNEASRLSSEDLGELARVRLQGMEDPQKVAFLDSLMESGAIINNDPLIQLIYSSNMALAQSALMLAIVSTPDEELKKAIQFFLMTEGYDYLCKDSALERLIAIYGKTIPAEEIEGKFDSILKSANLAAAEKCLDDAVK